MAVALSTLDPRACALPGTPLDHARGGIDLCVHCGFCLQACPTYVNLQDENDSPRGRIVLMREVVEGRLSPNDESVQTHIDRCLGCRACETACPSGVPYGHLLEATRATLNAYRPLAPVARVILATFARPRLLAVALAGARLFRATGLPAVFSHLGGRLGFAMAMLASTRRGARRAERGGGASGATAMAEGSGARGTVAVLQ